MTTLSNWFLAVATLLSAMPAVAIADESVLRTEDVVYGRKFRMALTLDVFQPPRPTGGGSCFW